MANGNQQRMYRSRTKERALVGLAPSRMWQLRQHMLDTYPGKCIKACGSLCMQGRSLHNRHN